MLQIEKTYMEEKCRPCEEYQPRLKQSLRNARILFARTAMAQYLEILEDMMDDSLTIDPSVSKVMKGLCDFCGGYSMYKTEQLESLLNEAIDAAKTRRESFYRWTMRKLKGMLG